MSMPRISAAFSAASSADRASLTPPALPRPPTLTCALTTTTPGWPPRSCSAPARASSGSWRRRRPARGRRASRRCHVPGTRTGPPGLGPLITGVRRPRCGRNAPVDGSGRAQISSHREMWRARRRIVHTFSASPPAESSRSATFPAWIRMTVVRCTAARRTDERPLGHRAHGVGRAPRRAARGRAPHRRPASARAPRARRRSTAWTARARRRSPTSSPPSCCAPGRTVVRVSVDGFHRPRDERYRRGRHSPEGFWADSYDYDALRTEVLEPFAPGRLPSVPPGRPRRRHRHRARPRRASTARTARCSSSTGSSCTATSSPPGGTSRCTSTSTSPRRSPAWPSATAARRTRPHPANARYVEGQRHYLAACRPASRATVVVDNRDLARPRASSAPDPGSTGSRSHCARASRRHARACAAPGPDPVVAARAGGRSARTRWRPARPPRRARGPRRRDAAPSRRGARSPGP